MSKVYGRNAVVNDISLDVEHGELLTLVGPSGCGKTTTLRIVAGFVKPTHGAVYIQGKDVTEIPPHRRDTGMVFQQYALFPHMTVQKNVEFGLAMRKVGARERNTRVGEALELVGLAHLKDRYPRQLSGGQQQRVALARVLVIRPKVLLFDEPLSNLDAKLRLEMRLEIRRLQQEVGITSIFVTHDQEEAITISDKIAVMNFGRIEQTGTPMEIFSRPATPFVADFVGTSNFLEGKLAAMEGDCAIFESAGGLRVRLGPSPGLAAGDNLVIAVRPEKIILAEPAALPGTENVFEGEVAETTWMGPLTQYLILLKPGNEKLVVKQQNLDTSRIFRKGEKVSVRWLPENCLRFKK
ncbi:MAG: ABC transporter ATP-binding protein [Bacillota bacterium]|nr:ABC transporter ATP-binding protein [Bacillota bacterium]